ncbi:MAG: methyltransferase domain-containing protein [Pseudomonadales bacterium]|nr:methyltransferase domain-containing protein [Pseudomonadales bacterium]
MNDNITQEIYDKNAASWERREPNSLSDFTGRPPVFDLCGDVQGIDILDIGCGEGYCARILKDMGASQIDGLDISEEMIELAKRQDQQAGHGSRFRVGNVEELPFDDDSFDMVLGMFVYNYLHVDEMERSFSEVKRVLRPGGRFIFAVPHPAFPQIKRSLNPPFYFDFNGKGYFSSRDIRHHGEISCRDGKRLPVQMVHKLWQDYFERLGAAGFTNMPTIRELGVLPTHLELDPDFFNPVNDIPLHMAVLIDHS